MKELNLNIEGMHCEGCSTRLTRVLQNLDGVKNAKVSLENKNANLEIDESVITLEEIKEAVKDAGFEVI